MPNHLGPEELSECAFSPQTAPAGWLEHAEGCAECSAELADLRLLLTQLAELPEPELPESVAIRLDATVARAWQEADAEREAAAAAKASVGARHGNRWSWRKIVLPVGSLALIALVVLGVGSLLHHGISSSSSASSGPAIASNGGNARSNGVVTEGSLAQWVQSVVLPVGTEGHKATTMAQEARCATIPQRAGYTVLTTSQRDFQGEPATLVVYQNAQEPSSSTVYAVVYEGSCPSSTTEILTQGPVNVIR